MSLGGESSKYSRICKRHFLLQQIVFGLPLAASNLSTLFNSHLLHLHSSFVLSLQLPSTAREN